MSILEDLFDGKFIPAQRFVKNDREYNKSSEKLVEHLDELNALLDQKEKELCKKIEDESLNISYLSERECFIMGFRFGSELVWQITHYKSENFLL